MQIQSVSGSTITYTYDPPVSVDLLNLQNGLRNVLLNGTQLPIGAYNEIRLVVNAQADDIYDSYIVINDTPYELRIPSGAQSGLKIAVPFTVQENNTVDLTIDIDLQSSIHQAGGQTNPSGVPVYMLQPSFSVVSTSDSGGIGGTLDPAIFADLNCSQPDVGYAVYVFPGVSVTPDDIDGQIPDPLKVSRVTYTGDAYTYSVDYLASGTYTVAATCQADKDDPSTDDLNPGATPPIANMTFVNSGNVAVVAGAVTTYNF